MTDLNPVCIEESYEHFPKGIIIKWGYKLERNFDIQIDHEWFNHLYEEIFKYAEYMWWNIPHTQISMVWRPEYSNEYLKQSASFGIKAIAHKKLLIEYKNKNPL